MKNYPKHFLDLLNSVKSKRAKAVIDHILAHGSVTTQEIKDLYGYEHAPRAVRDVREQGIPIVSKMERDSEGHRMARYFFGDPNDTENPVRQSRGRTVLSKHLKQGLIDKYGPKCFIYFEDYDPSALQIDHRIPFEIDPNQDEEDIECFMLVSPSANRLKSWACEQCENWTKKDKDFCHRCFWAHPESYDHVSGRYEKVVCLTFTDKEIEDYNKLIELSGEEAAQDLIKRILHEHLNPVKSNR